VRACVRVCVCVCVCVCVLCVCVWLSEACDGALGGCEQKQQQARGAQKSQAGSAPHTPLPKTPPLVHKQGQGKKSFWGMPKLNLTEAAQNFNKKFPGFVDAANKYNFTEAITKFNVSEAAAKYNVKLPPGLQNVKLPAAPADLSKYEALFKSALNRLPELGAGNLNITQQLSKAAPPLEEVVKAVNAASQLASALPKDKMPNMEQVMGGLNTLGSKIKTAADKLPSKQGAAAAPAPTVPRPTAAA